MENDLRGNVGESKVLTKFLELGYNVSLPFRDDCRYDMIVDDGENLNRVQAKTCHRKENTNSVTFHCQTSNSTPYNNIDYFVVYHPETESFFCVDFEDAPKTRMDIYLGKNGGSRKNLAENYRLTETFK